MSGLFSEVSGSPHYATAVALVQAGLFEEADALLDALESPDFAKTVPATWSAPDPALAKLGVRQSNAFLFWDEALLESAGVDRSGMLRVHSCAVYQARSYRYYRDLALEDAMAQQVKASAIPTPDDRSRLRLGHCMEGELWRTAPVEFQGPLRSAIDHATTDSEARKALSMQRDLLRARAPEVRSEIETAAAALSCETLCPWP